MNYNNGNLDWRVRGLRFIVAVAFAFGVFSGMPASAHHADTAGQSHFDTAIDDHLTSSHKQTQGSHIEKCGVASCAIAMPLHFTVTTTAFGTKTPFDMWSMQVTSHHLTPLDRPPKI
ncbi:hypothetical protein [Candidatus Nitrotoga sp. M5]|uniref:hypothetical protein n=1 Tax=Candidatus Nitrotoga sp. M5 TaxID=2890409 RepID=UPI001EF5C9F3|nr:hypothetical protein [Candidatus Nitrotoga sp. M5]CAH1387970.1 conserved hypothetical protein [Candidatus Nitrotoga sp. M5]